MNKKILKIALAGAALINFSVNAMGPEFTFESDCSNGIPSSPYLNYPDQFTNAGILEPEEITRDHFNKLLNDLSIVQEIYDFDPNILDNELDEKISIDPRKKNISFFTKIACFYSEYSSEREHAFDREIKMRIMSILKKATEEPYYGFPQPLRKLGDVASFSNPILLNIAIKDIFKDSKAGLTAFKDALTYFRDNGKLNEGCQQRLCLFNKLAGFYFDPQAIQYIIKLNDSLTVPHTKTAKLAFLRVLQLEGELFKQILPSTLNLADLPSENLLRRLRSKISHLSKSKLDNLLGDNDQVAKLFTQVDGDLKLINDNLKKIKANQEVDQKKSPYELWSDLKNRSEERSPVINSWEGISSFIKFLTIESKPKRNTCSFEGEINVLIPFPDDKQKTEDFFIKRKTVWNRLQEKGKNKEALSKELREKARINVPDEEKVFKIYQEVQGNSLTKEPQDEYLIKIMEISKGDFEDYLEKKIEIGAKEKEQTALKQLLMEEARFPSNGFGNFSNKYAEFCDKLKKRGFVESFNPYNWLAEPNLLETIFYKVNNINISSLEDKQKIRRERLGKILEIIEGFRELLGISTNLFLETEKESFTTLIYHKRAILEQWQTYFKKRWVDEFFYEASTKIPKLKWIEFYRFITPSIKRSEERQEIQEILSKMDKTNSIIEKEFKFFNSDPFTFYDLLPPDIISKISSVQSQDELKILQKTVDEATKKISQEIERILNLLSKSDHCKNFQEEFCNKTRFNKKLIVEQSWALAKVKSDYRSKLNNALVMQFIEKFKDNSEELAACEFFIASAYECLEEIKDYPELQILESTDQIRNYFFHINLSGGEPSPLEVRRIGRNDVLIYDHLPGIVAKEAVILAINIKAILEDLEDSLH